MRDRLASTFLNQNSVRNNLRTPKIICSLPYIEDLAEKITNIFRHTPKIMFSYRFLVKIESVFSKIKDKVPNNKV